MNNIEDFKQKLKEQCDLDFRVNITNIKYSFNCKKTIIIDSEKYDCLTYTTRGIQIAKYANFTCSILGSRHTYANITGLKSYESVINSLYQFIMLTGMSFEDFFTVKIDSISTCFSTVPCLKYTLLQYSPPKNISIRKPLKFSGVIIKQHTCSSTYFNSGKVVSVGLKNISQANNNYSFINKLMNEIQNLKKMDCEYCKESKSLLDLTDGTTVCTACNRSVDNFSYEVKTKTPPDEMSDFEECEIKNTYGIRETCSRFSLGSAVQYDAVDEYINVKKILVNTSYSSSVIEVFSLLKSCNKHGFSIDVDMLCVYYSISKRVYFNFCKYVQDASISTVSLISVENECEYILNRLPPIGYKNRTLIIQQVLSKTMSTDTHVKTLVVCLYFKLYHAHSKHARSTQALKKICSMGRVDFKSVLKC